MAKPTPNTFSVSYHNSVISGVSATTQKSYSNAHIVYTAANISTTIVGANLSYGMDLPPYTRESGPSSGSFYVSDVPKSRRIHLQAFNLQASGTCLAQANITLISTGAGFYWTDTASTPNNFGGNDQRDFKWIQPGGTNSNYYANLVIEVCQSPIGTPIAANIGGSAINTDLVLSTTRTWGVRHTRATTGVTESLRTGNLILSYSTDGGTTKEEYFRRPFRIEVYSERDPLA